MHRPLPECNNSTAPSSPTYPENEKTPSHPIHIGSPLRSPNSKGEDGAHERGDSCVIQIRRGLLRVKTTRKCLMVQKTLSTTFFTIDFHVFRRSQRTIVPHVVVLIDFCYYYPIIVLLLYMLFSFFLSIFATCCTCTCLHK